MTFYADIAGRSAVECYPYNKGKPRVVKVQIGFLLYYRLGFNMYLKMRVGSGKTITSVVGTHANNKDAEILIVVPLTSNYRMWIKTCNEHGIKAPAVRESYRNNILTQTDQEHGYFQITDKNAFIKSLETTTKCCFYESLVRPPSS